MTAISSLFTVQGLSVVLNHYFGTILNAAQGIANQVNGQLSSFSTNMMKALNPVIVKRIANADSESVSTVTFSGSKFSAILILLFAVPVCLKMEYLLSIWLEEVPQWTVAFCQLQLIQTVIVQMANPLATAIYGNGDIKGYAIWKSFMNIMPVLLSICAFTFKGSPIWLYISLILFMGIGGDIVISYFAKIKCDLSPKLFIWNVVFPVIGISMVMILLGIIFNRIVSNENLLTLLVCCIATTLGLIISLSIFGLTKLEKSTIKALVLSTVNKLFKN